MNLVGASDFVSYRGYLENCPGEFTKLFNTVLINVTTFFRDRIPWEFMSTCDLQAALMTSHLAPGRRSPFHTCRDREYVGQ